jgi:hypothetical protein
LTFANFTYYGDIDRDQPHGFGVIKWNNGDLYAGNFREGMRKAGMLETADFIYEG